MSGLQPVSRLAFAVSAILIFATAAGQAQTQRGTAFGGTTSSSHLSKKMSALFTETQNRHSATLDARLTSMWQEMVLFDNNIATYAKQNLTRRGALIYVRASGEPGEKTVRFFFYKNGDAEAMDGKLYKNIKEWFLPFPVAQAAGKNIARALTGDPDASYQCSLESTDNKVEVTLFPKDGRALKNPLKGESLAQK